MSYNQSYFFKPLIFVSRLRVNGQEKSNVARLTSAIFLQQINVCLLSIGFTLAFGGIFAKTWRVYKIFTNNQMKKEVRDQENETIVRIF